MNVAEGVLIFVTFAGPVAAVQAQKWIERHRDKQKGKDYVFRTLMATRAARLSPEHVRAINMIDLEFYGGGIKEKHVREAWKQYLDHLNTKFDMNAANIWTVRQDELFIDLLYAMAECVGYDFDKTHIKNSVYTPIAHGNLEMEQDQIRKGLVNILTGKASIPVAMVSSPEESAEQGELRRLLAENLRGERPYHVKIVNSSPADSPKAALPSPSQSLALPASPEHA
jgi:hypothetical protein